MFGLFAKQSSFSRALEKAGLERCSMSGADLWVGLPPDPEFRRLPVSAVPAAPRSVLFVAAPHQVAIIDALATGAEAATVENLLIGTSHDYIRDHRPPYDFSPAIAALGRTKMPALRRLSLGDMEQLFNGHGYFGNVGDITDLFGVAPGLKELHICGRAMVREPVRHDELQILSLVADDIAGHCGATDPETVANLLASRFPRLAQLHLSLETDDVPAYRIPEAFFTGANMPALEEFEIDCLSPEHQERLDRWKEDRRSPASRT